MNKDSKTILSEYVSSISDDDLKFLNSRLIERLPGDLAEVLDIVSKDRRVDAVFSASNSAYGIYDCCDDLKDVVLKECKKRGLLKIAA